MSPRISQLKEYHGTDAEHECGVVIELQPLAEEETSAEDHAEERAGGDDGEEYRGIFEPCEQKREEACETVRHACEHAEPLVFHPAYLGDRVFRYGNRNVDHRAEKHCEEHKFVVIRLVVKRRILLLQNRAAAVAEKRRYNEEEPETVRVLFNRCTAASSEDLVEVG